MDKKLFIESMEYLKKQSIHDNLICGNMEITFEDFGGIPKSPAFEGLLNIIKVLTKDVNDWIEHYIYELDWGKKTHLDVKMCGVKIPFETFNDLWEVVIWMN